MGSQSEDRNSVVEFKAVSIGDGAGDYRQYLARDELYKKSEANSIQVPRASRRNIPEEEAPRMAYTVDTGMVMFSNEERPFDRY